jgi:hypothetical protein
MALVKVIILLLMRSHNLICNQKQADQEQVKNKWLCVSSICPKITNEVSI